jgi:hypothetical protein
MSRIAKYTDKAFQHNVSQEFINLNHTSNLAELVLGEVKRIRALNAKKLKKADFSTLIGGITKLTGLKLTVTLMDNPFDFAIMTAPVIGYQGDAGKLGAFSKWMEEVLHKEYTKHHMKSTIDLKKVTVTGSFQEIPFDLMLPPAHFLKGQQDFFTDEELTAIILHEIGHAFFNLATIGEMVWMNYFLTDGIDVVLGKKPNTYRIELLSRTWLEKNVPNKTVREELIQSPDNEANVRKAVLLTAATSNRNHLWSKGTMTGELRSEQLADMFATRMGYGVHVTTSLNKMSALFGGGRFYHTRSARAFHNLLSLLALPATVGLLVTAPVLGIVVSAVLLTNMWGVNTEHSPYDNPKERFEKIHRELISVLRATDNVGKEMVLAEIAQVKAILDKMTDELTLIESIGILTNPLVRRTYHRVQAEQLLERLFRSDLFAHAERLKTTARS